MTSGIAQKQAPMNPVTVLYSLPPVLRVFGETVINPYDGKVTLYPAARSWEEAEYWKRLEERKKKEKKKRGNRR